MKLPAGSFTFFKKGIDNMNNSTIKTLRNNGMLWIVILYLLLSVIIVATSFYQTKHQELHTLTRGLYDANSLSFTLNNPELVDWRQLNTPHAYTIFKELETTSIDVRAIYYNKNTYIPPMIKGQFFQERDFYNGKKVAVVGKQTDESHLIQRDGKWYYDFQGQYFEVIGKMGASYHSKLDTTVLLNLDAVESGQPDSSRIYVLNMEDFRPVMKEGALKLTHADVSIHTFDRGERGAQRYVGTGNMDQHILFIVIALLVSSSVLFTQYWLGKKTTEIKVLWLMGVSLQHVYRRYRITYISLALLGYGSVCGMSYLLLMPYLDHHASLKMYASYLVLGFGAVLLCAYISMWLCEKVITKQIAQKGMRGL
ncbi:hypothetical protein [Paenibacillus sp. 481]|uniref:hypothetical protein n=1 Tax=Paenibacillus sp. 481 TaxID=2835869 RepID=UPI001E4C9494|nr:hypothetical protein [Paenibacillus sp. 481]UHA72111.1 hypothetical protein KIK04_15550 [Paenibacillus sp. 481]